MGTTTDREWRVLDERVRAIFMAADEKHVQSARENWTKNTPVAMIDRGHRFQEDYYRCTKPEDEIRKIVASIEFFRGAKVVRGPFKVMAEMSALKEGKAYSPMVRGPAMFIMPGAEGLKVSLGVYLLHDGNRVDLDGYADWLPSPSVIPNVIEDRHWLCRDWPAYLELYGDSLDRLKKESEVLIQEVLRDPRLHAMTTKKKAELHKARSMRERPEALARKALEGRERTRPKLTQFLTDSKLKDHWSPEDLFRMIQYVSDHGRDHLEGLLLWTSMNKGSQYLTKEDVVQANEQAEVASVLKE